MAVIFLYSSNNVSLCIIQHNKLTIFLPQQTYVSNLNKNLLLSRLILNIEISILCTFQNLCWLFVCFKFDCLLPFDINLTTTFIFCAIVLRFISLAKGMFKVLFKLERYKMSIKSCIFWKFKFVEFWIDYTTYERLYP